MKRERVDSSSLRSVGYDPRRHALEVEFRNGGVYEYRDVPEEENEGLRHAESMGSYLNTHIKPNYEVRRLRKPT